MKKYISLIALFLLTTPALYAQTKNEKAVAAAVEKLQQAMISGNRTELENIASNQLSYGHSNGYVEDKKEFVEKLASGKSDFCLLPIRSKLYLL